MTPANGEEGDAVGSRHSCPGAERKGKLWVPGIAAQVPAEWGQFHPNRIYPCGFPDSKS